MALSTMIIYIILGVLVVVLTVTLITIVISKYVEREMNKYAPSIYLGKINNSYTRDDINVAVKYLELTNGINSRK